MLLFTLKNDLITGFCLILFLVMVKENAANYPAEMVKP